MVTLTPAPSAPAWRLALWSTIALLLLAPLVAMQFTDEVVWTAFDFAFAGVLLVGAGLAMELAAWKLRGRMARTIAAGAILFVTALIWAEAAVGVF